MSDEEFSDQAFSEQEFLRYSRHLQLPQVGAKGQLALKKSSVVIVGCGGLGSPVSLYLAAAGVGSITLIDDDHIELSNLQRQIVFSEADIGQSKAEKTRARLTAMNRDINIEAICCKLNASNARELLAGGDLIIDCSDNFNARYIINDTCRQLGIAWVYASVFQFSGQCAVFEATGPCFRCLFPKPPTQTQDCSQAGVLGVLPGVLGTLQALEALKYLLDQADRSKTRLLLFEGLSLETRSIQLQIDPSCLNCGSNRKTKASQPEPEATETENTPGLMTINPKELKQLLASENVLLVDVRSESEHEAFNIGGKNIPIEKLSPEKFDPAGPVIFYCQVGARSAAAATWALENDLFDQVYSLEGGLNHYLSEKATSRE